MSALFGRESQAKAAARSASNRSSADLYTRETRRSRSDSSGPSRPLAFLRARVRGVMFTILAKSADPRFSEVCRRVKLRIGKPASTFSASDRGSFALSPKISADAEAASRTRRRTALPSGTGYLTGSPRPVRRLAPLYVPFGWMSNPPAEGTSGNLGRPPLPCSTLLLA